jgi:hypothetical protein
LSYHVTWAVFGPDERTLDRDAFPDRFDRHEEALAFVLDKLSVFASLGFDRDRGFWGRSGAECCCETRFSIARHPAFVNATRPN